MPISALYVRTPLRRVAILLQLIIRASAYYQFRESSTLSSCRKAHIASPLVTLTQLDNACVNLLVWSDNPGLRRALKPRHPAL